MTVNELIDQLKKLDSPNLQVQIYDSEYDGFWEVNEIHLCKNDIQNLVVVGLNPSEFVKIYR